MGTQKGLTPGALVLILIFVFNIVTGKYVIRLRGDGECPMAGYFRDEMDCRKFYRCAEHPTGVLGQNYITKSEFHCPPGTIFDEALSNCNHIMFVHNIPSGCDVSSAAAPVGGGGGSSVTEVPSSTTAPQTSTVATSAPEGPTPSSANPSTLPPPLGISLSPLVPPEHNQMSPVIPGGSHQQPSPMFPSINLPSMPPSGGDQQQQQPMFPAINIPQFPDGQMQPPMIPGFPAIPGGGGNPLFPSINVPQFPDGQVQPPSIPGDKQQQQNLLPSFNFPQLPQIKLPSTINIHTVSRFPNGQFQLNTQNNNNNQQQQATKLPQDLNLQNLASVPTATVTLTALKPKPPSNSPPSWITPQQFPGNAPVNSSPPQPQEGGEFNNEGGGWIVPDNFPTFYSSFGGTPFLFSAHSSNLSPFIMF